MLRSQAQVMAANPSLACPCASHLGRSVDTLLHRLRLDVAYTKKFLYRIQFADDTCCACGDQTEDVHHVLLECPLYATERKKLSDKLSLLSRTPLSLPKLLGPWDNVRSQTKAFLALREFFQATKMCEHY